MNSARSSRGATSATPLVLAAGRTPIHPLRRMSVLLATTILLVAAGNDPGSWSTVVRLVIDPVVQTVAPGDTVELVAHCSAPGGETVRCPPLRWRARGGTIRPIGRRSAEARFIAGSLPGQFLVQASDSTVRTVAAVIISGPPAEPNIVIRPGQRFQTIRGWEASASAGWSMSRGGMESLAPRAVAEAGISRLRLTVTGNQVESRTDLTDQCDRSRETPGVNDNADPTVIDPAGFHWFCLDRQVEDFVLPMERAMEARGERLLVNVCYVGFALSSNFQQENPAEYAELVQATLDHLRERYGLEVAVWEARLEADNINVITGGQLGRMVAAAGARARAAGYPALRFGLPSTKSAVSALAYFKAAMGVHGAAPFVGELIYHRYGRPVAGTLAGLAEEAAKAHVETAMLEHYRSGPHELWEDLTQANVSSWAKYALAGPVDGGKYGNQIFYADIRNGRFVMRPESYPLRQYFHYVRPGDVRIGTTQTDRDLETTAFQRPDGGVVVVVNASRAATLRVGGLPAGTYNISYSGPHALGALGRWIVVDAGGVLLTGLPDEGTLTISP